ncbi:TetR/AcrR family transcriptional regulator [Streptomyces europaeiscabiei]|uniref:TetR family transcriptional regulator n=1 Tax=Streptomyces europaeiscabiei TaxID=146819 RepID=A0ABU4NK88_9ACTN|nr:TetR family transcriptional regulator [Streptomyces europaeiscabiei]MDX2527563.1 TetR family transcriptional regulator [Streptomyces europaeiscabiei]MDX2769013.1 TetR family transcriptional regulator [Streptomyces europaeiscabiei]MDX3545848.1 TetR family transcriptional regulator [Streptomyces europaeiscabiei]MDX3555537.1 TetR family transcriptional regulator [Streptomyces europaeiscabiei]MDX3667096.1 TetR family transcriptional regulator [Streptomyces europaeiscabiei]
MTDSADAADTPRSRRPRKRLHYGEGREALLNAAVHVVARGGLRRLTYRAVAEKAEVTHGLVVHHFGSRDALVEEALAHTIRTSLDTSSLEPGTGKVADFSTRLSEMVTADPDTQAFQYELLLESRRRPELLPQIRELYDEYFDAARRELGRILPAGADKALTRLVFAALDGLVLHQLVLGEPAVTDAALEELRSLLRLLDAHGDAHETHAAKDTGEARG